MGAAPRTWSLSGFGDEIDPDPEVQAAVLLALGASRIEVRSACGVNVADFDAAAVRRLAGVLRDRGLGVSAVASPVGKVPADAPVDGELARLRAVIATAQALEAPYVRIFSFYRAPHEEPRDIRGAVMERLRLFAAEAEAEGVVLVHENEKGIYGDTPERVLDIMEAVGSPALRVAWDSANFVQAGLRPHTDGYQALRPYLEHLHVKDALAATGRVVAPGEGDGELRDTVAALAADGYSGCATLEPHLAGGDRWGGFSGPRAFGEAARAFRRLAESEGVRLA